MVSDDQDPGKHGLEMSVVRDCRTCPVRNLSLFDHLTVDEMKVLNQDRSLFTFKSGEYIYQEGTVPSGLYCLSSGKVKIEQNSLTGNSHIIALKRPGEFVGFGDLMSQSVHASAAIALEDCNLCYIPKNNLKQLLYSNNTLAVKIIHYLSTELQKARHRTASLTQKHMRARLAEAIIYVFEKYENAGGDTMLNVNLRRSDLAALSNMTTANAIRTLSEFSQDHLVQVKGRSIKIIDLPALRKISLLG